MPDLPASSLAAAESAIRDELKSSRAVEPDRLAQVALEAAAPILAEAVAQKILAHMEEHGPVPASPGVTLHETMRRAWRRHFRIAAQIASRAFSTHEDQMRKAAEAIKRGDVIGCVIPEVPREVRERLAMAEGDKVTVSGVIAYDHPGNDWVEIRFAEGSAGTAIVPRSLLSAPTQPVCPKCGTAGCLEDKALDW